MIDTLTLINGDCIETMKSIQNEFIDLIVTDPPILSIIKQGGEPTKRMISVVPFKTMTTFI